MNKKQLIARVQRYMGPGATRSTASAAVEAVLASIQQGAQEPKGVHITRVGSFAYKKSNSPRRSEQAMRFEPSAHFTAFFNK